MRNTLFTLLFTIISTGLIAQVSYSDGTITIENQRFTKRIKAAKNKAGAIQVLSLVDKSSGEELLNSSQEVSWFEFVIANQLISSNDPFWQFQNYETRQMGNGGTEVKMLFTGKKGAVKNLQLEIINQVFPNSTLVREQITLTTNSNQRFSLNKRNGELHFVFPQYSLKANGPAKSTEIRIATWGSEVLDSISQSSYDDRRFDNAKYHNLAQAHMFHPKKLEDTLEEGNTKMLKGPFGIVSGEKYAWLTAYEHASQDNLADPEIVGGLVDPSGKVSKIVVDEQQGVGGEQEAIQKLNQRLNFLGINQKSQNGSVSSSVNILRGGYLDGELITKQKPYSSVWTASAFYPTQEENQPRQTMHDYMLKWICENPVSRKPEFYYNTWGMQRDLGAKGNDIRGVFTYERIFQEMDYAEELGVDIFVLDDGWEQTQGVWKPHRERLKDGLKPIYDRLQEKGLTMGIWLSPLGIDSIARRYQEHPEWVIRDDDGKPIPAQWGHPAFDFVSGFYDLFVQDCKWLIDQGVRFFKWDAINTFYPSSTDALHGNDKYSKEEVIARYGYLLPIFVKNAMAELTAYEPDLVIEIDLTEDRRSMVGLAMLAEGKLFWMNNGASGYGDYSQYRAKSMRGTAHEFAGIVPLELFTYANYPHNAFPYFSQRYNVNSSLVAGRGFWGNLDLMTQEQRVRVGEVVRKAKKVLPYIGEAQTEVIGRIGSSPEVYTTVNVDTAAGQVIAFSGSAMDYEHRVKINPDNFLAVLNNGYTLKEDSLVLDFQFPAPDATREAFILTNNGNGISIASSTSWLDDVELSEGEALSFTVGAAGEQLIYWSLEMGEPKVAPSQDVESEIIKRQNRYEVKIKTLKANKEVRISK